MTLDIQIKKYAIPFNEVKMKRLKIIAISHDNDFEEFLVHQKNEQKKVDGKIVSVGIETVIVGALENYHHEKMIPVNGNYIFEIKDKKFSKEVYDEVGKKAVDDYGLKGKITFW